jgi:O-antigen ligase
MVTGLPFVIRFGLLVLLAALTWRYSKRDLQSGVLLFLGASLFPLDQAILWREGGGLPLLTMERVVWPLILLSFFVQRLKGKIKRRSPDLVEYCMIAFLAVIIVSMCVHGSYVSSVWGTDKFNFYEVLSGFGLPFIFYCILRRGVSSEAQIKAFLAGVGLITVYLGVTGVGEAFRQNWLVFPKYILDPDVGIHFGIGRVRGPFVQASWNGLAIVMGLPILLWLYFNKLYDKRWLWVLGIAAVAVSLVWGMQRAVWLGAAAALGLTTLTWPRRGAVIFGVVLLALTLGFCFLPENSAKALMERMDDEGSLDYRLVIMDTTWSIIKDHLMTGVGFSRFQETLLSYGLDPYFVSHNTVLTLLAELGLLGILPYVLIFSVLFFKSVKAYLRLPSYRPLVGAMWGITAAYVIMLLSVEMRLVLYPNLLFFCLWAILLETIRQQSNLARRGPPHRRISGSRQPWRDAHLRKRPNLRRPRHYYDDAGKPFNFSQLDRE